MRYQDHGGERAVGHSRKSIVIVLAVLSVIFLISALAFRMTSIGSANGLSIANAQEAASGASGSAADSASSASGSAAAASSVSGSATAAASAASVAASAADIASFGANFLDNNAGLFPDTFYNSTMLNTGNRGCNSCHTNLFDTWKLLETPHIVADVGYEAKNGKVTDCLSCHEIHSDRTGVYFGDIIHASHYSSDVFVKEDNGNCWSCHAMNSVGYSGNGTLSDPGDYQWLLWEEIMYEGDLGGYPDADTNANARGFTALRGFGEDGYITGVSTDDGSDFDVELRQEATPEEDVFVVNNFGQQVVDASTWTLDITGGVNEPRSFTLDDLKALPQTEKTCTIFCGTNGVNTAFFGNIPVKGVLLSDLIDACGGLADGTTMLYMTATDTWVMPFCVEDMVNNGAIIALEMYGHELTADQGYPATMVNAGMPGASWVKWLSNIDFEADENPFNPFVADLTNDQKQMLCDVNSCWLANDGMEYKLGETISIEGWSYAAAGVIGRTATIEFSADFCNTWKTYDVPADYDPYQLVYWTFNWKPQKAGTYILKVQAISDQGYEQTNGISSIIVTVTE